MKEVIKKAKEKMEKTRLALEHEFASIRAGRANPAVLDKITVDFYGSPAKIETMASVSVSEARMLVITPWDKNNLKDIEKAIMASDLGITPSNDGSAIRLNFPPLTEERRKSLCKDIKHHGEEAKVALRNIRHDVINKFKAMKKNGELTEDEIKNGEKEIQKVIDEFSQKIDKVCSEKEKEIMTV